MTKLLSGVIGALIAIGVAWGFAQWLGDGEQFLSPEWFTNAGEKLDSFQSETSDKIIDNVPEPESLDLPDIGEHMPVEGEQQ